MIVSGYASLGNPITGPQNTYQNDYQGSYSIAMTRGRHNLKFGAELDRQQINALFGIATNGFFVFAPFPASDSFASFLLGQSVQFFQGGGQFDRGLRKWIVGGYAQDEWRVTSHLTLNFGLRYEVNTPYTEIRNRLNAWDPGQQSSVFPTAPEGLLFPGDPGVPAGIAPVDWKEFMPRVGFAWDPFGDAKTTVRAGYGIFYDGFTNGTGGPLQAAISALPWTQAYQLPGPGFNIANPYGAGPSPFGLNNFVAPATVLTVASGYAPALLAELEFLHRARAREKLPARRSLCRKQRHAPAALHRGQSHIFANNNQREYSTCNAAGLCNYGSVGLLTDIANSTYHALQVAFSRQYSNGLRFTASYWYSKSLDDISTLNVAGSAPTLVAGENDLAQNPFDLAAEHGPSLFDATHRFVFSGTYALPQWKDASKAAAIFVNGWQANIIASLSTGTPFTVYDSANVSQQGSAPEITGFYSSKPNLISNPNVGQPHNASEWVSRAPFQQLNPVTQAGQFGNEGRNVVRGPGIEDVDFSLFKNFSITERTRLQFRAELFNLFNHANLGLPENDLESPAFGQILQAGSPRLLQLAIKANLLSGADLCLTSNCLKDCQESLAPSPFVLKQPNRCAPWRRCCLRGPSTLTSGEREMIATFVSARNDCYFCQASHRAAAAHHLSGNYDLVDAVRTDYRNAPVSPKLKALLTIAASVQQGGRNVTADEVAQARKEGATDLEIHDTVLIAAAFCMYNRYVDGLATLTPLDPRQYEEMGARMAAQGYTAGSAEAAAR